MNPQKEFFGFNSIINLSMTLMELEAKRIFLVTGGKSFNICGAKKVIDSFIKHHDITEFSDFSPNPKIEDINKGLSIFEKKKQDVILAVGGGSVMDIAKAIKFYHFQNSMENIPLMVIPTTAGTGSEATHFFVYYKNGKKFSGGDKELTLPDYVILDPSFTLTTPTRITASTSLDAFSQAIESYWSIHSTNESRDFSTKAMKLFLDYFVSSLDGKRFAREKMMLAANYSGKAINITKTTAPHAVSYYLTTNFDIPHGIAVALTLGEFFVFNSEVSSINCNDPLGPENVKKKMGDICLILGCRNVLEARSKIHEIIKRTGTFPSLSDYGITFKDLGNIASSVNTDRLKNNPRMVSNADIRQILKNIL